jgi:outer membrane protein
VPYVPQVPEKISEMSVPRLDEVDPELVYSAAQTTNPLIKGHQLRIKSMERTYASQKGLLYPSLSANGALNTSYTDVAKDGGTGKTIRFNEQVNNNFRQSAGLSLNIPILAGWQQRTAVQRAKLDITNQELKRDQDLQTLRQDIYTAHANAVAAIQKFSASSKGVEASQRAFDFATKRYDLGLMNTIDYITTQNNLFKAQIDKVSAQYDFIFRMKLLEFYRDQKITL